MTQSQPELRALVAAGLRMLCERGVLSELEGRIDDLMDGAHAPPVLLKIHHARLLHLLPRSVPLAEEGQWSCDPGQDPEGWLRLLHRPGDEVVRVASMLTDRAVVRVCGQGCAGAAAGCGTSRRTAHRGRSRRQQ